MELKTVEEMADILKVHPSWIYRRTRTNQIPFIRVGSLIRFNSDEVENFLRDKENAKIQK